MRKSALGLLCALAALAVLLAPGSARAIGEILDSHGIEDLDTRTGSIDPTAAQQRAVDALGATATWTRFGTSASLYSRDGYLSAALTGTPAEMARGWIAAHRDLYRLSAESVAGLQLVNVTQLGDGGDAVLFRQRFGALASAQDGMIAVGLAGDRVVYASSSAVGDQAAPQPATLGAVEGWARAAASVGRSVSVLDATAVHQEKEWTVFTAPGFSQQQRARLVAFPTLTDGARAAWEANVVDVARSGAATAFTAFVDARTGDVLFRQNRVDNLAPPSAQAFSGTFDADALTCGPYHDFTVAAGTTTIDVTATATVPSNDIVLTLSHPQGTVVGSSDVGTSPEAIHHAPESLEPGTYSVQVCPYPTPSAPPVAPYSYSGTFATSDAPSGAGTSPPRWKFFTANPPLDYGDVDTRVLGCWLPGAGCDLVLQNLASRAPWDYDPRANAPTMTTKGNNASSAEAWLSPLTPAEQRRPVSATREYVFPWTDQWQNTSCSPGVFASAGQNDIDAATANLFAMHNRMHDFAYNLGFTERTYNLQDSNFGNTGPGLYPLGREGDPELGDAQAGGVDGGYPSYLGRDNANQITLQDGIPPITNMYLWQPIAAAFYPPCVDGDYDMSVIGHEYTHAISNRMVGGPDANLTGLQAGSMGESWSDLDALEYLHAYGYVPTNGENPWSVGAYVTGNKQAGIRDYPLDTNPLNYSDVGFDVTGPEVHADGEIWNGVNYELRQALVAKYDAQFPSSDRALQQQCADGKLPADRCPGNRRWIQIVYDGWLLMQPAVSMVDARDAYLAADRIRFGGANQTELWRAFAHRGLGGGAASKTNTDDQPTPSFETPLEANAPVTFAARGPAGEAVNATFYVGGYEARVTPLADTDPGTALGASANLVPGAYSFTVRADGYGVWRFSQAISGTAARTLTVTLPRNWASRAQGATITGDGVNQTKLIDDTESSNWTALGRKPSVAGTSVVVDLSGGRRTIRTVQVSAMLHPADASNTGDTGSQNRFTALRQFELWACDANDPGTLNCTTSAGWTKLYTSAADAFPGVAPRPVAPDLIMRTVAVPATAATHLKLVVLSNQCTGGPQYQGEQDTDPLNVTGCPEGSARDEEVRAAELQAFSTGFGKSLR